MALRIEKRFRSSQNRLRLQRLEQRLMLAVDLPEMLRDIRQEKPNARPTEFVVSGDKLFIAADDGISGRELLVTDGIQPPKLVKDILPGFEGSDPSALTDVDGVLYFVADDGEHGRELWKSDGTEAGTTLVADIHPETDYYGYGISSYPSALTPAVHPEGAMLYFTAHSPDHGTELWKADASGASIVADLRTDEDAFGNSGSSFPLQLTFWQQHFNQDGELVPPTLYFTAETESLGRELWKTQFIGGNTTTSLVKNLAADSVGSDARSSDPTDLIVYQNQLYFAAEGVELNGDLNPVSDGRELWRTDGTDSGTELVADLLPGYFDAEHTNPLDSSPSTLTLHNGQLFFAANGTSVGRELWRIVGDTAPQLVHNIRGGAASSNPSDLMSTDGFLFFIADGGQGRELWRTDGSATETKLTRDIRPFTQTPFTFTRGLASLDNTVFFGADDGTLGPEVWMSDGTFEGTSLLKEIQFGRNATVTPSGFTTFGEQVYFEIADQIWMTDVTAQGTQRLAPETVATVDSIEPSFSEVGPPAFAHANGLLFFAADDGEHGVELWKSDGTEAGTTLVHDLSPGTEVLFAGSTIETPKHSYPEDLTSVGDRVFFRLRETSQLFSTDGTAEGTQSLGNVMANHLVGFQGKLVFAGEVSDTGNELWSSDGTPEGTTILSDLAPGVNSSHPSQFTATDDQLFFVADTGNGDELWVTDGTPEGTKNLPIAPGGGGQPTLLTSAGNRVFFRANDGEHGSELWVSDGTPEGTHMVKDLNATAGSQPIPLAAIGDSLLFFADDGDFGQQLWKSDGTPDGTVVIKDIWPSDENEFIAGEQTGTRGLVSVFNGNVYFPANDGGSGTELWSSDGTESGTVMVRDLFQGGDGSYPNELTVVGDRLFFAADQSSEDLNDFGDWSFLGRELWTTDGTEVGTVIVSELNPINHLGSQPQSLTSIGGTLYFTADNGVHGREVWTTDLRLKADDHLFEILAREVAYRDALIQNGPPIAIGDTLDLNALGYPSPFVFTVDLVIHDATTGFDAYGLIADNSDPILVIRGSLGIDDAFSDLIPEGNGTNQYEANRDQVFQWIDNQTRPNRRVSVTGHSLGGALTQLIAAGYTASGGQLAQVVTFNAPGISTAAASLFDSTQADRVKHYITNGDPVSLAGDTFIEGQWRLSDFDDWFIVHNHQYPVLVDFTIEDDPSTVKVEKRLKSESLTFVDFDDVSNLNSPLFYHTDLDYFMWLAGFQLLVSTTPQLRGFSDLPGKLLFRTTTESTRQQIGQFIADHQSEIDAAIGTLTCQSPGSQVTAPDFEINLFGLLDIEASDLAAMCLSEPARELRLQGQVRLPQINNATADFSGGNYIGLGEEGFELFGRLSIDELPLLPGVWRLHDLFVDLNTVTDEIVAGGSLDLPTGVSVAAELGFLEGQFNRISLETPSPSNPNPINQPLGATGVFLQRIKGQVDHVAQSDPNPIVFSGEIDATAGPTLSVTLPDWAGGSYSGSLIDFGVNGLIDQSHLEAGGLLEFIHGLANVEGQVIVDWSQGYLESQGDFTVLDGLITASGAFRADSNFDVNVFSDATFGVPDAIPLIGGLEALTGKFTLDYQNDVTNSNDFVASWTTFNLPLIGETTLGFRVFLDGGFGIIGADEIASLATPASHAEGEGISQVATYTIEPDVPWAILSAQWDPEATDRSILLTTPAGVSLTESQIALRSDIAIATELSDVTRRVLILKQPEAGNWQISLDDDAGLNELHFNGYISNAAPTLQIETTGGGKGAPVDILINALDVDSDAKVSLFYDVDRQGFDGIRFASNLAESASLYSWTPDAQLEGNYFVYAVIDDGINPIRFAYAESSVEISPGPKDATVFLPVSGGEFEVLKDGRDIVVRDQNGNEWFRDTESDLLSITIKGVSHVHDTVILDPASFAIPIAVHAGQGSDDEVVFSGSEEFINLAQSPLLNLQQIGAINLERPGSQQLSIDAASIAQISGETGFLRVHQGAGDTVVFVGEGWQVEHPVFIAGRQWHVLSHSGARLELANLSPHTNPWRATDVNRSGDTTPLDALQIINLLAPSASSLIALEPPQSYRQLAARYPDVNGSGTVTPIDALQVINAIARKSLAESESSQPASPIASLSDSPWLTMTTPDATTSSVVRRSVSKLPSDHSVASDGHVPWAISSTAVIDRILTELDDREEHWLRACDAFINNSEG